MILFIVIELPEVFLTSLELRSIILVIPEVFLTSLEFQSIILVIPEVFSNITRNFVFTLIPSYKCTDTYYFEFLYF